MAPDRSDGESSQADLEVGLVAADRQMLRKLSQAKRLVAQEEYGHAIVLLHAVLNGPEDAAFATDDVEPSLLRNLRLEAERVIGELPAAGLKTYELYHGADARRMLQSAVETSDASMLAETARRYFHTQAGCQAAYLLATVHLDRGHPLDAAVCFQRLHKTRFAANLGPDMLALQIATSWVMADMPELARPYLTEPRGSNPDGTLPLADPAARRSEREEQALAWLRPLIRSHDQGKHSHGEPWTMFRGNASRSAASSGAAPVPKVAWKASTSSWRVALDQAPFSGGVMDVARQIKELEHGLHNTELPAIPGTGPLIVNEVVLLRTLNNLQAIDLATGQLQWQTDGENELEQVRRGEVPPLPGDRGSILDPMLLQRVFTNSTYGTLSAAGELVFCLEDLGFVEASNSIVPRNQPRHPLAVKQYNRLCAHAIRDGQLKWSVGGKPVESGLDLSGHFFLGPPLPLADRLYCLAELNRQVRLLVLDAKTGKLAWRKSLQSFAVDVMDDQHRGQSGLSPSHADGVLVCPTGSGVVVALDLATRHLMWSYRYRELDDGNLRNRMRMLAVARRAALQGEATAANNGHWLDSLAIIAGGRVILTPRDCDELLCLNLSDGTLLWKQPRDSRAYIGGVHNGKLVVVGLRQIEMLDIDSGQPTWQKPVEIPIPSGRGILVGNRYHVPLSTSALATVDLEDGRIVSMVGFDEGLVPGNLVSSQGFVVSQGADSLVSFQRQHPVPDKTAR